MNQKIVDLLGNDADDLLNHKCKTVPKENLHLPGPDFVDRTMLVSDRSPNVMRHMQLLFNTGRLSGTGYMSILPVDQGIEHSGGASFAPNPIYFDPENIIKLAIEGQCNAVASTLGVLGSVARKYAHKIPFLLKLNHNEILSYPNTYDQILFAAVDQAFDMGFTEEELSELQLTHYLEGSTRKEGNRVRITVQLINAHTKDNIWDTT